MTTPIRPRTIVTADPELDDLNSMIRFLLYANEVSVEGLIYASSRFHWRGDGKGTAFFLPEREYDTPQTSWRWKPGERFIHEAVDAYAQVYGNLAAHDERYPDPAVLRGLIREGNVDFEGDVSQESPGSELIAEALLDDDPGPVHVQLWAGPATLARALMSIEERYADTPEWEEVHARVSAKTIVTKFASQDGTYDDYIRPHWPDIRVTDIATAAWGYMLRFTLPASCAPLIAPEWLRENVTSVGPLGALYRVWGDGRQMVPGDVTDFFHLAGFTADELREQGYHVWMDPQPAGSWISEGDTMTYLNLIVPGLRGFEHPSFGGWGGRAELTGDGPDEWAVAKADDGEGPDSSLTRWFADAQADFAARLRWSVTPSFADAAHAPILSIHPGVDVAAQQGAAVRLQAAASSPDDVEVTLHWWIYEQAGTCAGARLEVSDSGLEATLHVPTDAAPGQTVHVIVEARNATPDALVAYRRVILTVN